jgi:hypothetical protein
VLAVLAAVEVLALAAPVATWSPISRAELDLALMLVSLSVTYSLFVIGWEKARRLLLFERAPAITPDILATWCFAAALLLPPQLAAAVTAVSAIGDLPSYNPTGTRPMYRYLYSTVASSVLAATVASWIFRHHLAIVVALPAAAAGWLAIGAGATVLAMCASGQFESARAMVHPDTHHLEATTMVVAIGEYAAYRMGLPLLIWLSLPVAVAVQRYFTRTELQSCGTLARPMDGQAWLHVAKVIVEASEAVSIVRIDTIDAGSARMVALMQAGCDAIGSYPDGGLAILLPDCPPAQGDALARRLRIAMTYHKVTCHIASASKPRDGHVLADLLAVSEAELVLSRDASRRSAKSP